MRAARAFPRRACAASTAQLEPVDRRRGRAGSPTDGGGLVDDDIRMGDDYYRHRVGSREHYAAYEKQFLALNGVDAAIPGDPEASYEIDHATSTIPATGWATIGGRLAAPYAIKTLTPSPSLSIPAEPTHAGIETPGNARAWARAPCLAQPHGPPRRIP